MQVPCIQANDLAYANQQQEQPGESVAALTHSQSQQNHQGTLHSPGESDHARVHLDGNQKYEQKSRSKEKPLLRPVNAQPSRQARLHWVLYEPTPQPECQRQSSEQKCATQYKDAEAAPPAGLNEVASAEDVVQDATGEGACCQHYRLMEENLLAKPQGGSEQNQGQPGPPANDPIGTAWK